MASLTAAETTIRRSMTCSHLLNRKAVSETVMIFRQQSKGRPHTPPPVNFRPGKDTQRRPGEKTLLGACIFPRDRIKSPMSLRSHGSGEEGALACDSVLERQSG